MSKPQPNPATNIGAFKFNKDLRLLCYTSAVNLTRKETALLTVLVRNMGTYTRRFDILKEAWGSTSYLAGRSMDVYIARLKKLLAADPNVRITNKHGVGFMLEVIN